MTQQQNRRTGRKKEIKRDLLLRKRIEVVLNYTALEELYDQIWSPTLI